MKVLKILILMFSIHFMNYSYAAFGPKEDKKWCGGKGKIDREYPYDASAEALKACDQIKECGAVNCPKGFNKCELLKHLPPTEPCNGSPGDFLWRKEMPKADEGVMSKFLPMKDKNWCAGQGGIVQTFKYHEQKKALKACANRSDCNAVNCPKNFNKCELLKNLSPSNPCNGSKGDLLWRKK